ncbi:MAG: molecular chaperone TorD family protein [Raoultibacter sp.]
MMSETSVDRSVWRARAVAWELLGLSLRYPDAVLVNAVIGGGWADAAEEIIAALSLKLPSDWSKGVDEPRDTEALLFTLRAEATHLFVGAPTPACSPYEGVWRAEADGVQALMFVSPYSLEVEQFAGACGLGRPEGTNEPLDHVSTECELLQYLASLCAGELPSEGTPAVENLPGGSPEAAYSSFFNEHAETWLPHFVESLAIEARHPFYYAAAMLLGAMMKA